MVGKVHAEVEDQAGSFILVSNKNIDAIKKDGLYADILLKIYKREKSTNKKSLKESLKVTMQNRLRNVTLGESNKTGLAYFTETSKWLLLRPIDTAVVDTQH